MPLDKLKASCKEIMETVSEIEYPGAFQRAHYLASTNPVINRINIAYAAWAKDTGMGPSTEKEIKWGSAIGKANKSIKAYAVQGMLLIGVKTYSKNHIPILKNQEICYLVRVEETSRDPRIQTSVWVKTRHCAELKVPISHLSVGFAVTYHRAQGQTFTFPVYLDLHNLFECHMLYVGATRHTHIKNALLVK